SGNPPDTTNGHVSIVQPPETVVVPVVVPSGKTPTRHDAGWVKRQLARARDLLASPDRTSTADAYKALQIAKDVLPYTRTVADSVEAQYREMEASLALTPPDPQAASRACRILRRIQEPAAATPFARGVEGLLSRPEVASTCY